MADNTAPVSTANAALDPIVTATKIVETTVSPSGSETTTFTKPPEPAPVADAPPKETVVIVRPATVEDSFTAWLEATGDVLSSLYNTIVSSIPPSDDTIEHENRIDMIMATKHVNRARAEQIYERYRIDKGQSTPGDTIHSALDRREQ